MMYDGVSRVVFLNEPGSGVKSFVCSFVDIFAKSLFLGKTQLSISTVGRDAAILNGAEKVQAQAETAYYATDVLTLKNVFSNNTSEFDDWFEFQINIDSDLCGRIRFLNILGQTDYYRSIVSDYGMSMVIIILDGKKLSSSDTTIDLNGVLKKLKKLAEIQPNGYPFSVLFAVSKADLIGVDNTQSESFFENSCGCCKEIIEYCKQKKIKYRFVAFSAANKITSKVFNSHGKMISDPDFEPWNIETVGLYIISNALPTLRMQYMNEKAKLMSSIEDNRGIYNSDSFRSTVEARYSREQLALLIKNQYQLDQYVKYSRQIVVSLADKIFNAKSL
ncbi:MAG: hypothetical protein ACI4KM_10320 [Oscillospiraceae bacterium]